jgi:hypothetical protein
MVQEGPKFLQRAFGIGVELRVRDCPDSSLMGPFRTRPTFEAVNIEDTTVLIRLKKRMGLICVHGYLKYPTTSCIKDRRIAETYRY